MYWCIYSVILNICVLPWVVNAGNVLHLSFSPSTSHHIWEKTISMGLRDAGHNITYVTPMKEKSVQNFTVLHIEGVVEKQHKAFDFSNMANWTPYENIEFIYEWLYQVCKNSYKTEGVKNLIKHAESGVKYDVILFDITTGHCFYPLIEKFGSPPVVATCPFGVQYFLTSPFGVSLDAAFIPLHMMPYTEQMTFFQRLNNYFYSVLSYFWHHYLYMPKAWDMAEELFGQNIIDYQTIEKNFSIVLANYDPKLDYPRPLPPSVIPVGGLHVKREFNLSPELKSILDNSKDGVILFTLGSRLRSDMLDKSKIKAFVNAFSKLKQTVLWKFETKMDDLPKNVIIESWLPQNDILAHPNMKLLITHGGGLSTQEAMHYGIPIIGIPFLSDQHVNMRKIAERKLGIALDYKKITQEILEDALKEVLENPMYKENMGKISRRYRDQPPPGDALSRAVFWVEYAMRNGDGQHLGTASRYVPFYQLFYIDIWLFIVSIFVIVCFVIRKLPIYCSIFQAPGTTKEKTN